jgi:hypothetical protein
MQELSIVHITEKIPLSKVKISWDLQNVIGEKYCFENKIVVFADSENELTVAISGNSFPCIDELRKLMPKNKKINVNILDADDIQSLFVKVYDLSRSTITDEESGY